MRSGAARFLAVVCMVCFVVLGAISNANATGPYAYIPNMSDNSVSVVDTSTNMVVAWVWVGSNPIGIAVNPAGTRAYVTNCGSNNVSVIDTSTNNVIDTVWVGSAPVGVAVNPNGAMVYVANQNDSTVSVIDTTTNTVVATVPVGVNLYGIAVNPAGTKVYVGSYTDSNVSVIDTSTNTVTDALWVWGGSYGVAVNPAGTRVYTANYSNNAVSVIDIATGALTTVYVGQGPADVAVNPDGTRAYVSNLCDQTVSVIDTSTNNVVATVPVGPGPYGLGVNPAGTMVYVSNAYSNDVSVIDTSTNAVIATIPVGYYPSAFGQFFVPLGSAIAAPIDGMYLNGTSYTIAGTAGDNGGPGMQKVEVGITPSGGSTTWYDAVGTTSWTYSWNLPADGSYTIQSRATDKTGNVETPGAGAMVTVDNTVHPPDTTPPVVSAGSDRTSNAMFMQTATATDTDSPYLTYAWTKVSGPGGITFGSPRALSTMISAGADGLYVIQFTATDAAGNSASSTMTLTWDTTPPVVSAGSNKTAKTSFTQTATATDANVFTCSWSEVSGPGTITFGSPNALSTTISASFDGTYVIQFTAIDAAGNPGYSQMTLNWDTTAPKSTDWYRWTTTNGPPARAIFTIGLSPNYASDQTLYAGSWVDYGLYKSTDGGTSWTSIGLSGISINSLALSPNYASDQTVFAGTYGGSGVYKSTNGGASWTAVNNGITHSWGIEALAMSPNYAIDQTIYAGDYNGDGVFKSTDGGTNWSPVNTGLTNKDITAIAVSPNYASDQTVYVATYGGGIFKSTDGGANWSAMNNGLAGPWINSLAISPNFAADHTLFAGSTGYSCGMYKSTDGGASWNDANTGLIHNSPGVITLLAVGAIAVSPNYASDHTVFIVNTYGDHVYKSMDGGASWTGVNVGSPVAALSSFAISPNYASDHTLYVGDYNTRLKKYQESTPLFLSGTSYTITGSASDNVSGVQYVDVSTDGGINWHRATGTTSWSYNWSLPVNGIYTIQSRATDNVGNVETPDTGLTVTVNNGLPADTTPPVVSAGSDIKTANTVFTQNGTATDTDSPTLTYAWTKVSGTGTITFGMPTALSTTISASADGMYVIQLTATDAAGNSSNATMTLWWDTTPPTLTWCTPTPPNAAGWNNTDISVPFTVSDNLSGVASTSTASPLVLSTEGAAVNGTVTVTDAAGNPATFTSPSFKIDKTAPTVTATASPSTSKANNKNVSVTVSGQMSDALSGPDMSADDGSYTIADSAGTNNASGNFTVKLNPQGKYVYSFTVLLPASVSKDTTSRKYKITVRPKDNAGNVGTASTTFVVN